MQAFLLQAPTTSPSRLSVPQVVRPWQVAVAPDALEQPGKAAPANYSWILNTAGGVLILGAGRRGAARRERRALRRAGLAALNGGVYPASKVVGEKDACGVGMIANVQKPASHELLEDCLRALTCMEHRGACSSGMDSTISMCGREDRKSVV